VSYSVAVDIVSNNNKFDQRECILCQRKKDFKISGRLIPIDKDRWVHANCALWSTGIDEQHHYLLKLHHVLERAMKSVCVLVFRSNFG
jgi:hypothetical protein